MTKGAPGRAWRRGSWRTWGPRAAAWRGGSPGPCPAPGAGSAAGPGPCRPRWSARGALRGGGLINDRISGDEGEHSRGAY